MSEFVNAKNKLNPDAGVVSIPVAWFDTPLGDSYVIVDKDGEPCLDCDERLKAPAEVEAPAKVAAAPVEVKKTEKDK